MREKVLGKKSQQNKTKKQGMAILTSDKTDLSEPTHQEKYGR